MPSPTRVQTLNIPVSPYRSIAMQVPELGLTEAEWDTFLAVLDAMRPGLIESA
jgi:hypothetical protein